MSGEERLLIQLKKERDTALAACAEMRKQLSIVWDACCELGGNGLETIDADAIYKCLSTDCGKGFVSVKELEPTVELLLGLKDQVEHPGIEIELARLERL